MEHPVDRLSAAANYLLAASMDQLLFWKSMKI